MIKRIVVFFLMMLSGLALFAQASEGDTISVFFGYDGYGNEMIEVVLLPHGAFKYTEKFLDGSSLIDSGKWELKGKVLVLRSSKKVMRKHHYQTYRKAYKFRGDSFEVTNQGLRPVPKVLSKGNAYFLDYTFVARRK